MQAEPEWAMDSGKWKGRGNGSLKREKDEKERVKPVEPPEERHLNDGRCKHKEDRCHGSGRPHDGERLRQ